MRVSPLDARHRALDARMLPFGGWDMPIQYKSVLEEHRACREDAAIFDVSHLGTVECADPDAFALLQWLLTNDLNRIEPGRAQYTHLLDADDAHVVDDIIVWWVERDRFFVMPNASNTDDLMGAMRRGVTRVGKAVGFADITASRAVLAVQGPNARERLAAVSAEAAGVARFDVRPVGDWVVAGTGYTGEDGVEIHVAAADAPALWDAIVAAGVTPAGLGARDTLRLEAGLPLHGHELGPGITPLQAGLGWVVRFDKGPFRGSEALQREKDAGVARLLRGFSVEGRRPAREGAPVFHGGAEVGVVTSGNFSPTLGHAIALGFVPPAIEPGAAVELEVRGKRLVATVVKPPFVSHNQVAPAMTIRDAEPRDLPEILAMVRELAEYERSADEVSFDAEEFGRHVFGADAVARVLLAEHEGAVAGMALYYRTFSTWVGRPGIWLEDLFVRPAFRRHGLGRALLDALRSRTDGRVEWAVLDWNTPAHDFYRTLGAHPMEEWTVWRWPPVTSE